MPGLRIFTSNRMEILAEHLSDVLKSPLEQPLASEIILVQSKGMERWLSMVLARRHGICTNVRFPYPIHFVQSLFREILPDVPEHSPYQPVRMTWDIMHIFPSLLDNPGFEILKTYLNDTQHDLKLFQLSERIADLYDQYLLFRPEMILRWDKGLEDHWQAKLWREIVQKKGPLHRAALYQQFLEAMRASKIQFKNIHERISVFGISALPPFHIQILSALSSVIDVNLFLMNPCREFWGDIVSDREMNRFTTRRKGEAVLPEDLYLETGNRLLSSMGALGQEFFQMIGDIEYEEASDFQDPGELTLLSAIQSDILNLKERSKGDEIVLHEGDDSIRVHSCHSSFREIEVLQDSLLALFQIDSEIQPDDVLVMIPDIERHAPLIQAVFSIPSDDPRWIPFSIADRVYLSKSSLVDIFIRLLDLAGSRYTASSILDILESEIVRSKFSLAEEDLELIHHWIRQTGIRWGIDGENKKMLDLPAYPWNTWRAGLDRMLLGSALPAGDDNTLFMGILPFNDIEGGNTEVLGGFLKFVETLFRIAVSQEEKRTLLEWTEFLLDVLHSFFSDDENHLRDFQSIRREIQELSEIQTSSGFDKKISFDVIKAWLRQYLKDTSMGAGFLTGGVTFCTILPMRSIPFKVICLIGMNDDSYPRQSHPLGFDLMARSPRIGDRSRRKDDRYLFLEAILSARGKLHISYVGQSMKDNSPRPPSVLVSEILDYIEEGFGEAVREEIVIHHRLQAFSPAYFSGGGGLFSYSGENLRAAQRALSEHKAPAEYISFDLSEPQEEWKTINLESLFHFFTNPARFLLQNRLGIYLNEDDAILDENEPFELNRLEQYFIRQGLVARALEGKELRDIYPLIQASGRLPHGSPGMCSYGDLYTWTRDFVRKIQPHLEGRQREPIEVDLFLDGFHLTGRLENIYPRGLVSYRLAKVKGRDRIRAWINHLVLNYHHRDESVRQTVLVCEDKAFRYLPLEDTAELLHVLLSLYLKGLRKPLHLFAESSLIYAERMADGKEKENALRAAMARWDAYEFAENDDPYYQLCFRQIDPLDNEFCELAIKVFSPMLNHEEQIKW